MFSKFIVPGFAVLGFAAAQSAICSQSTATINNQAEATALATACSTVNSITLAPGISGDVSFGGIQQIKGALTSNGAVNMTGITFNDLNSIGGAFNLQSLTMLSTLAFPQLTSVGSISWVTLPAIQSLTFTSGISKASNISITDTGLTSLDGLNPITVGSLDISINKGLRTITSQLTNCTGQINIASNGLSANGVAVSFPKLTNTLRLTVQNLSSLSIPSLKVVNEKIVVLNSFMQSVMMPNLTSVGGDFYFTGDSALTNISAPLLTSIGGGLTIANNSALQTIDGFGSLSQVGSVNLAGNIANASLPALKNCKGSFSIRSTGNVSCAAFATDKSQNVIMGTYTCTPSSNNVQVDPSSGAGSDATPSSTKSAAGATRPADLFPMVALTSIVGAMMMMGGLVFVL